MTSSPAAPRTTNPQARASYLGRDLLWLAAALGVTVAVANDVEVLVRARMFHEVTRTPRDLAWQAAVSNTLLFALLATPFALLVRARPDATRYRAGVFAVAAIGAFATLLLVDRVHPAALALLALGVAAQLARSVTARPAPWRRHVRRYAAGAGLVATSFGVFAIVPRLSEQRAMAGLPPTAAGAPNILIIILDTVGANALSLYGYPRTTSPNIDALASSGTVFDWAFAAAPWTLPSHASMFTGRRAATLSAGWRTPLDDSAHTLAEALSARGYATGAFVANLVYTSHGTGIDQGFLRYDDFLVSKRHWLWSTTLGRTPALSGFILNDTWRKRLRALGGFKYRLPTNASEPIDKKHAESVTDEFLEWQRSVQGRPFFAFLNYYDAHSPFQPPPPYAERFGSPTSDRNRYDGAIAYMDEQLGRLFDELARRGVLDSTLVVVTSDHGEQFGEHGLTRHGNSLYIQLLRVPLVVRWPGHVPAGLRVSDPVSLRDLPATVLEADGSRASELPGSSFSHTWRGGVDSAPRTVISDVEINPFGRPRGPTNDGAMESAVMGRLHYIRNLGTGREELYDFLADPTEMRDLANTPDGRAAMPSLRQLVELESRPVARQRTTSSQPNASP